MTILEKLFNKKGEEKKKTLLDQLNDKNIIYSYEESDNGYKLIYLDCFDKEKYVVLNDGEKYKLNNKSISENEILNILEKQSKIDNELEKLLYEPCNDKLIQIYDFFKTAFISELIVLDLLVNENKELVLNFSNPETGPFTAIHIEKDSKKIIYDKENKILKKYDLVIRLIQDIKSQIPLYFDSGEFKVPKDTPFTDIVNTYLNNESLVDRLNKTKNIEAKLINVSGKSAVFIIFKNGAALEYILSTKQNPDGKLIIIDVDEETTLEDNEEYGLVQKILSLPTYLNNKPNEDN
ncbi:hypothetical protein [Lacrimispora amygdalina]|uniref:hypothetical protein n=1 Tax=Lacrimispora amygdalina TaxID=253257 RepID=UPI000BE46B1D|nr:hypothetical protein [Lacrimispora amygdalina]